MRKHTGYTSYKRGREDAASEYGRRFWCGSSSHVLGDSISRGGPSVRLKAFESKPFKIFVKQTHSLCKKRSLADENCG